MIDRLLPRAEWHRLAGTELDLAVPYLPPDTRVIVVEEGTSVVGCWSLPRYLHAEGLWIHPAYRRGGVVGRRLLRRLRAEALDSGDQVVITAAMAPEIAEWCVAVGGAALPGQPFVLPIRR